MLITLDLCPTHLFFMSRGQCVEKLWCIDEAPNVEPIPDWNFFGLCKGQHREDVVILNFFRMSRAIIL